jgi:hypothetical protein
MDSVRNFKIHIGNFFLDPSDPAIPLIRSGGVTTSLVLPGSGNVQGGEAAYVKLYGNTVYGIISW